MIRNKNLQASLYDRVKNGVFDLVGTGAPTNGTSGTGVEVAGPLSTYTDLTNHQRYVNLGTEASPLWSTAYPGELQTIRTRNTIAEANAGATILAALPGYKYRVVDGTMTAIGGAVAAVTTVDIIGTLAASARKIFAFAQAGLTQSARVRSGSANGAVLADGASATANDANTAITIGKTGSDITTATHIDTEIQYVIEKA